MTDQLTSPSTGKLDFLMVTGLSGAGLQTAAKVLEDLGWYVASNLPPELVARMVELALEEDAPVEMLAVVIDTRSRRFTGDLASVIDHLEDSAARTRVLYLDASDEVLVRRFEQVRRSHPMQYDGVQSTLAQGIAAERAQLAPVKAVADVVIDTSTMTANELRQRLEQLFGDASGQIALTVQSFGFKYGLPTDVDAVCDVRFLPNPYWVPELRPQNGLDAAVSGYVLGQEGAREYLDGYRRLLELTFDGYAREGKRYMTVAVGCTGGKHRSVAMAEALAREFADRPGLTVRVMHRDLGRE